MFAGQGAQYPGMARGLYLSQPTFRAYFEQAAAHFPLEGASLADLIFGECADSARLQQTGLTQPAVFAIDYALGSLLLRWGVKPACMLGHSIGEYVAVCKARRRSCASARA
jgi:acyl transferase domain-containing protein